MELENDPPVGACPCHPLPLRLCVNPPVHSEYDLETRGHPIHFHDDHLECRLSLVASKGRDSVFWERTSASSRSFFLGRRRRRGLGLLGVMARAVQGGLCRVAWVLKGAVMDRPEV